MKLKDMTFDKIENYDPYNSRANRYGMVKEWVGRNGWGNAVVFGNTKAECIEEAKRYIEAQRP